MTDRKMIPGALTRRSVLGVGGGIIAASTAESTLGVTRPAPPASDLMAMDAVTLATTIRSGRASCVEVMTACLDRIERVNPAVNAVVALQERGGLLAEARERDAQRSRGDAVGLLHGFPHAVKDLQAVKGVTWTRGSPIFRNTVAGADGLMVERLRKAGAIFIGKTNTPEFGLGSHTYNDVYGVTRNPYDPSRSAGGSSGGAAVALALRMVPLADGSDFGGSLRNPSGWNNVLGLRPSFGRVATGGDDVWFPGMSVVGPMARTVPDLALLLAVQSGNDPRAPLSMDGPRLDLRAQLSADMRGKKIGWLGDFGGFTPCEPGVLDICRAALKGMEAMGCVVEEALPGIALEPVWRATRALRAWQSGGGLLDLYRDPAKRALLKPEATFEIETGMALSAYDLRAASVVRTAWYSAFARLFNRYDYLVAPTAQVFPFDAGLDWPHTINGMAMKTYHEWMKANLLISMTGCPSLAIPAGFGTQGLPMGVQIIAPVYCEHACLQLGHAYQQAHDWTRDRPPPSLGIRPVAARDHRP